MLTLPGSLTFLRIVLFNLCVCVCSNSYRSSDDENSDSGSSELKSTHHNSDDEIDSQLSVPKYLQCPAIFRISNLKKFVMHKFGIDPNKFCVEIMYKVKTIALPDYYTLMDVAYIYTWKRVCGREIVDAASMSDD